MNLDTLLLYAGLGIAVNGGGSAMASEISPMYDDRKATFTPAGPYTLDHSQMIVTSYHVISADTVIPKRNFRERYARIARTSWFSRSYVGKSLGDTIQVEE